MDNTEDSVKYLFKLCTVPETGISYVHTSVLYSVVVYSVPSLSLFYVLWTKCWIISLKTKHRLKLCFRWLSNSEPSALRGHILMSPESSKVYYHTLLSLRKNVFMANKVSSRKITFSHRKLRFVSMARKVCHGEEIFVTEDKSLPG